MKSVSEYKFKINSMFIWMDKSKGQFLLGKIFAFKTENERFYYRTMVTSLSKEEDHEWFQPLSEVYNNGKVISDIHEAVPYIFEK